MTNEKRSIITALDNLKEDAVVERIRLTNKRELIQEQLRKQRNNKIDIAARKIRREYVLREIEADASIAKERKESELHYHKDAAKVVLAVLQRGNKTMQNPSSNEEIYSFIGGWPEKGCLIVLPVKSPEKGLAANLESKIAVVLDEKTAMPDKMPKIPFAYDSVHNHHGFLAYSLTTPCYKAEEALARFIAGKLDELQPAGFEQAGLAHRVIITDHPVLQCFLQNGEHELQSKQAIIKSLKQKGTKKISIKRAAEILRYHVGTVKKLITLNHLAGDNQYVTVDSLEAYTPSKGAKQMGDVAARRYFSAPEITEAAAYEAAASSPPILYVSNIRAIMGFKSNKGAREFLRTAGLHKIDEKRRMYTAKTELLKALPGYYRGKDRWISKKENSGQFK